MHAACCCFEYKNVLTLIPSPLGAAVYDNDDDKGNEYSDDDRVDGVNVASHFFFKMSWFVVQLTAEKKDSG